VAVERIFGLHAVRAVLERRPHEVRQLWLQSGRDDARTRELAALATQAAVAVGRKGAAELDGLAGGGAHQGVLAEVLPATALGEDAVHEHLAATLAAGGAPLCLVLDGVQDPHNLGAVLRTADAAGVDWLIAPRDRAAGLTAAARKVAAGAAETVPFAQVTNLARCLDGLKAQGLWLVGAAEEASEIYYDVDLTGPIALVLGAEGAGLRRLTRERCDRLVRVPMLGGVSSLNVSVTAGVLLYETLRQRRTLAKTQGKP
jgi:23S rRNA (guanosine2251-2'-O)-methyltransferase